MKMRQIKTIIGSAACLLILINGPVFPVRAATGIVPVTADGQDKKDKTEKNKDQSRNQDRDQGRDKKDPKYIVKEDKLPKFGPSPPPKDPPKNKKKGND